MESIWQKRVKTAVERSLDTKVFAAFNTNVDVVVHMDDDNVQRILADSDVSLADVATLDVDAIDVVRDKNQFVSVLKDCLGKGKSFHIVLEAMELLDWLESVFPQRRETMGGQAGIIANQMAALGADSTVYTSLLAPKQAGMFFPEVRTPVIDEGVCLEPIHNAARVDDKVKINWIFEYKKDLKLDFAGETVVTPRANRVILATRPAGVYMGFQGELVNHLSELGQQINVAFMAGYHYAPSDPEAQQKYLNTTVDSLKQLKAANEHLRMHYEYVPMSDQDAEKNVLAAIAQEIQSFGINENEIKRVLKGFGYDAECQAIEEHERAYCLYEGTLRLMEALPFERIQLHNLGYYILVLKKPYAAHPEAVRDACLFASSVNAIKARDGGYVSQELVKDAADIDLSGIGYDQLQGFAKELMEHGVEVPESFLNDGILDRGDHYVLLVPAHVIPNPVSTVGMGDTISSSSYACEFGLSSAIAK